MSAFPKTASEGAFACIPCDRGFTSSGDLALHLATHERCDFPSCSFAASGRALAAHAAAAHRPAIAAPVLLPPGLLELIPPKFRGAAAVGDAPADLARLCLTVLLAPAAELDAVATEAPEALGRRSRFCENFRNDCAVQGC
jgi:hypothetical protein